MGIGNWRGPLVGSTNNWRRLVCAAVMVLAWFTYGAPALADFEAAKRAFLSGDYKTAHAELVPLAKEGDAKSRIGMGLLYAHGLGVKQDYLAAYRWFDLVAGQSPKPSAVVRTLAEENRRFLLNNMTAVQRAGLKSLSESQPIAGLSVPSAALPSLLENATANADQEDETVPDIDNDAAEAAATPSGRAIVATLDRVSKEMLAQPQKAAAKRPRTALSQTFAEDDDEFLPIGGLDFAPTVARAGQSTSNTPVLAFSTKAARSPGADPTDLLPKPKEKVSANEQTAERMITVRPGQSSSEIVAMLKADRSLRGVVGAPPAEGSLLPGRYPVKPGDTIQGVLAQMQSAMNAAIADAWTNRPDGSVLKSSDEVLVLASIVQREVAVDDEMPVVASVFLNRLSKGMRLQADTTVIYALTGGPAKLGRSLTRRDLKVESPYNTYERSGLPPTPIGNPSRAAIRAVLRPARTNYLFFVADGKGRHRFSEDLAGHDRNVAQWKAAQSEKRQPSRNDRFARTDRVERSFARAQQSLRQLIQLQNQISDQIEQFRTLLNTAAGQRLGTSVARSAEVANRRVAPQGRPLLAQQPAAPSSAQPSAQYGGQASAGSTVGRDPFAVTERLRRVSAGGLQELQFVPSTAKQKKLPKMKLRGVIRGAEGEDGQRSSVAALLDIKGSGVFVVREGDTIGLHDLGLDSVIKVVKVDALSLVVETGTLGQVIIVR